MRKLIILLLLGFMIAPSYSQETYKLLTVNNTVYVSVGKHLFMIDTGANVTLIHSDNPIRKDVKLHGINESSKGMLLEDSYVIGRKIDIVYTNLKTLRDNKNMPIKGIIGSNFLKKHNAVINYNENLLILN